MARTVGKLTALTVAGAKLTGTAKVRYLSDGGGLYLRVGEGAARSWVFRYRAGGRLREMGIGAAHTLSLAEARERARDQRKLRLDGADPIAMRKAARAAQGLEAVRALTFRECAEAYIAAHGSGWGPVHAR